MVPLAPTLRFTAVLKVQLGLFGLLYLASLLGFVLVSGGITERFTALATGPYLGTVILAQLRVLPAYLLVALAAAVLSLPWLRRAAGPTPQAWRLVAQALAVDAVLVVLSLGPFLRSGPGLIDAIARKLAPVAPHLDLYVLYRWHLLDAFSVAFAAATMFALWTAFAARWSSLGPGGRRVLLAGLALLPVGALAFRDRPPRRAKPGNAPLNVLILASDSLRADRLGLHGAARRDISPHLDAFATQAVDFDNVHVATASTLESWTSAFSGQFPPGHGLRAMYPRREEVQAVEASTHLLPRLLSAAGYLTSVSSDWVGNCFALVDLGFERRHVGAVQNFGGLIREASTIAHTLVPLYFTNPLGEWLLHQQSAISTAARPAVLTERLFADIDDSVEAGRPFFSLLFVSATHLPYNASWPFSVKYADPAYDGPHRYQVDVRAHELITTGFARTLPPATIRHLGDLYDGAVSEFDDTVGRVLEGLEARGLSERTIVVVTSDHGEDLYELGSTLGHGTNFFGGDQSTRIPLLVRVPSQGGWVRPGARVSAVGRNVDLAPTLLELLGQPVPPAIEGVSLAPLLRGEVADLDLVAFAETCYLFFPKSKAMTVLSEAERADVVELAGAGDTLEVDPAFDDNLVLRRDLREAMVAAKDRMVRTRRWKFIEIPGRHRPITRLFDLDVDPTQQRNLAGTGLAVEDALAARLHAYWAGQGRAQRFTLAEEGR